MNSVWLQWTVSVEMSNQGHLDVPLLFASNDNASSFHSCYSP